MAAELVGLEFLRKNEIKNKSCDPTRPYAFISYSHDSPDAQIVMNVFNILYNKGYNLWIDAANLPHSEEDWRDYAIDALRNKCCAFTFFFRSESSMSGENVAKELETSKNLRHVQRIVTVDIWHDERNTASKYYIELLNGDNTEEGTRKYKACERICNVVSKHNSAIRLAADVQNDILKLAELLEEELQKLGVLPLQHGGGKGSDPMPVPDGMQAIPLPDFLKQYNLKTFVINTFQKFRLAGRGEYAKYTTSKLYKSAYPLVWDFVEARLKERGASYIQFVNEQNAGSKNPPFITVAEQMRRKDEGSKISYRHLEVSGLEDWAMCIHYGQYAWINDVLRKRLLELNLPLEEFSLEYIPAAETAKPAEPKKASGDAKAEETAKPAEPKKDSRDAKAAETAKPAEPKKDSGDAKTAETAKPAGSITRPVDLGGKSGGQGKRLLARNSYCFTLFGERYTDQSLKNMLLIIFKTVMDRHPDKMDELVESLPCLMRGNVFENRNDRVSSIFLAGTVHTVGGTTYSIGTSMGRGHVLSCISRLMKICGEGKENLVIDNCEY